MIETAPMDALFGSLVHLGRSSPAGGVLHGVHAVHLQSFRSGDGRGFETL